MSMEVAIGVYYCECRREDYRGQMKVAGREPVHERFAHDTGMRFARSTNGYRAPYPRPEWERTERS
jgi:hypothetical protein